MAKDSLVFWSYCARGAGDVDFLRHLRVLMDCEVSA